MCSVDKFSTKHVESTLINNSSLQCHDIQIIASFGTTNWGLLRCMIISFSITLQLLKVIRWFSLQGSQNLRNHLECGTYYAKRSELLRFKSLKSIYLVLIKQENPHVTPKQLHTADKDMTYISYTYKANKTVSNIYEFTR